MPGDTQSPNSASIIEKSPREGRDIMELEHIKARCIRVKGVNSQSHIIDVSDLLDAKAIREKIFAKFNVGAEEKASTAIFAVDSGNTENQSMSCIVQTISDKFG